jgi:hypothetical protein
MKRTIDSAMALACWTAGYLVLHGLSAGLLGLPRLDALFFGLCGTGFIFGLLYAAAPTKAVLRHRGGVPAALLLAGISTAAIGYAHYLTTRSLTLYRHFTEDHPKLIGRLHRSDPVYGYRPLKAGRARVVMFPGDTLPYFRDADGFRVPVTDTLKENRPGEVDIMFFGCSFTEGAACPADSVYPHLVAKAMGLRYINAGVSSWGLSQMYLMARECLPKYKPRYAVFQYSPWLPERGLAPFKYGSEVPMPKPFFERGEAGRFDLRTPPYASHIFDLDRASIRSNYLGRFPRFLFELGIPFLLREDRLRMGMRWGILTGRLHPATNDIRHQTRLSLQVYAELIALARAEGATPVILHLPSFVSHSRTMDSAVLQPFDRQLVASAPETHRTYLESHPGSALHRDFIHWRLIDGDSVRIDIHPNPLSHRLIAAAVIDALKKTGNIACR